MYHQRQKWSYFLSEKKTIVITVHLFKEILMLNQKTEGKKRFRNNHLKKKIGILSLLSLLPLFIVLLNHS